MSNRKVVAQIVITTAHLADSVFFIFGNHDDFFLPKIPITKNIYVLEYLAGKPTSEFIPKVQQ